jgi:hypothetical protein
VWRLTRKSLTGAAFWLVLAVVCILTPFDELADSSDLFDWLGSILGGTVAKYSIALLLAAAGIYSLKVSVPRRSRSSTPDGSGTYRK